MPARELKLGSDARAALKRGVDAIANAVKPTLGPLGRCVLVDIIHGPPQVTHDGATIAKELGLADHFENMGVQLVQEAAIKTNDAVGDGTTTTVVLTQAIVAEGMRLIAAGANPMLLKRGIDRAAEAALARIKELAAPVRGRDDIIHITRSSVGDPELGDLVGELAHQIGKDGIISIEDSRTLHTETEYVDGMVWNRGFVSRWFTTDANQLRAELEEPAILMTDMKLTAAADVLPVLRMLVAAGKKEFVLVCDDVEGEALAALITNKERGAITPVVVKAPAYGTLRREMLLDLAALTGGQFISEETGRGLDSATLEDLGQARRVTAKSGETTVVDGYGPSERIDERIEQIRVQLTMPSNSDIDREKLQERLAGLSGGVGIVKVGAATEVELMEKRRRVEDGIAAAKAVLSEGYVAGGGVALVATAASVDGLGLDGDEAAGALALRRSLEAPLRTLAQNAGARGAAVVEQVRLLQRETGNRSLGYNALTGAYEDLVASGIIDPVSVVRSALVNAVSMAGMILTVEVIIADRRAR
jgi:chaperonin GroEL